MFGFDRARPAAQSQPYPDTGLIRCQGHRLFMLRASLAGTYGPRLARMGSALLAYPVFFRDAISFTGVVGQTTQQGMSVEALVLGAKSDAARGRPGAESLDREQMSQNTSLASREILAAPGRVAGTGGPELSVVIPTFKERQNILPLLKRLESALAGLAWEAIFVDDDSPDGTADIVKQIGTTDCRVRCLRRVGRRGLAGACIEGILSSSAPFVAVIDADLQHDEKILPHMLAWLRAGGAELVVGSRYVAGGSADSFSRGRGILSRAATWLARTLTRVQLTDPMSGFFMMRRESFDRLAPELTTQGFKILLDIAITAGGRLRVVEHPYVFGARQHGESKLDAQVGLDFIGLLLGKLTGGLITPRFVSFGFVGALGLIVHLGVLRGALAFALAFPLAQSLATFVAMTGNFLLNNRLTYRDRRLSGWMMLRGLTGFYVISLVGALSNVGIASWLYAHDPVWWLAGLAGAVMGAVWNYSMSNLLVWRVT
jgi:dolichol-phosphate mannosyltransferase